MSFLPFFKNCIHIMRAVSEYCKLFECEDESMES